MTVALPGQQVGISFNSSPYNNVSLNHGGGRGGVMVRPHPGMRTSRVLGWPLADTPPPLPIRHSHPH